MKEIAYIIYLKNSLLFKLAYFFDKSSRRIYHVLFKEYPKWNILKGNYIIKNSDGDFLCKSGTDHDYIIRTHTEIDLRRFFLNINPGVFIDVGAHIGKWSIVAVQNNQEVKVISLEPNRNTYEYLKENINLNNMIESIRPLNIGAYSKKKTLNFIEDKNLPAISKIIEQPDNEEVNMVNIQVQDIDSIIKEFNTNIADIRLIKIDVEGAELNVIIGMGNLLSNGSDIRIICEIFDINIYKKINTILCKNNFTYETVVSGDNHVWYKE